MFRVALVRMVVKADQAEAFEAEARKQLAIVSEKEPGTILYGFLRRAGPASTILGAVSQNFVEYIHPQGYASEDAQKHHLALEFNPDAEWTWGKTFPGFMNGPNLREIANSEDVVAGISRNHNWTPANMYRFAFHRFKIKAGQTEAFEEQAKKQVQVVSEQEPGTILYTFCRRSPEGSTMIPKSATGNPEYMHLMAYTDEAALQHHRELENRTDGWAWGPVFREFLEAPLENESLITDQLITAVTRDAVWSPTTP